MTLPADAEVRTRAIWLAFGPGISIAGDAHIRAWTSDPKRASELRSQGLDMIEYVPAPEAGGEAVCRHGLPPSACTICEPLHRDTEALVDDFAVALKAKLRRSQQKYGYTNGWLTQNWKTECRQHLLDHVAKGDPLDVAAYAAFMWKRGWSTAPEDRTETCSDCGHVEPCDEKCPNCNDANEYGDYEGPTCEVCNGAGRVPATPAAKPALAVRTGHDAARLVADYLALRSALDAGDAANIIHILNEGGFLALSGQPAADLAGALEEAAKIADKMPGYVSCELLFEKGYYKGREDVAKEIRDKIASLRAAKGEAGR